jgi:rSAM-associated Gly-rich repeat protein
MTVRRKTKKALAMLLPAGVLGISSALASTHIESVPQDRTNPSGKISLVADRLREIRTGVSAMNAEMNALIQKNADGDPAVLEAVWLNGGFGWRNGGWGNGGWHNAPGWGNGGWGNGGWHNAPNWGNGGWGNGWHNAPNWGNGGWHNWHNFWHNW